ncbi:hypothetical protein GCM10010339_77350 [Streptomyces alanosinicus]|uniref:Uncharacterized protein n=1 Tax=Streptomyces alanosinicus TaxID=68171 RepID=A0A918YT17_9ACTN|nr:hypothetical protein GCM10010339_77350 [Streptomyces alanosinicus]
MPRQHLPQSAQPCFGEAVLAFTYAARVDVDGEGAWPTDTQVWGWAWIAVLCGYGPRVAAFE